MVVFNSPSIPPGSGRVAGDIADVLPGESTLSPHNEELGTGGQAR